MEDHHNHLKNWNQKCHVYVFCLLADLRRKQIILGQSFSFVFPGLRVSEIKTESCVSSPAEQLEKRLEGWLRA